MKKEIIAPEIKFSRIHLADTICTSEIPVDGKGDSRTQGRAYFDDDDI